jgi:PAS domain S-box-containing protein
MTASLQQANPTSVKDLRSKLGECGERVPDAPQPGGTSDEALQDRQWAEAVLAGEKRVLEMIARNSSLNSILDALCSLVEKTSSNCFASIYLLDVQRSRLRRGAAPSLPKAYADAIDGRIVGDGWGPCGIAATRKQAVIISDIKTDSPCAEYRDLALAHGLHACWSTPVLSFDGKALGTFAVYCREPRSPTPRQRNLLEQFAQLASIAIERTRGQEALHRSQSYLAEAQKLSHTGSFGWNVSSGELIWSDETFNILGYDRTLKPTVELVLQRVHPEDIALVQRMISVASHQITNLDFEHRIVMPDGLTRHLQVIAHPVKNCSGEIEFIGAVMDVTERKRAEARIISEKRLLEMIARGGPLSPVLHALCRHGEQLSGNVLVSILLVSHDGKRLRHGAAPSLPQSYTAAIDGALIGPRAGSCGTAVYRREPVIVSDISTEPLWENFRDLALSHGLRACWSTPIFSTAREVIGTFALYSREPGDPTAEQRNIIEQMTHLAAVAIERERAEEALRSSESRFQGILEIAEDAIISVDSQQRILLFNQGAEKTFGYAANEVFGKSLELLMPQRFATLHQRHVEDFARSPEISRTMAQRREVFGRRKDGREFPAEASISKLDLGQEIVFTVILRDITERKDAAEALRAAAQLARGQTEALSRTLDALAMESDPDRLVEHVLRTIIRQLDANSTGVWLRNQATGLVNFEFALENGKLLTKSDSALGKISPNLRIEDVWLWPEVFRSGKPGVIEDIREGPPFPWRDHVLALGVVTILVVPMLVAGQVEGVIGIRFTQKRSFRAEETELAQAMGHQAMLACQLRRLSRHSRQAAVAAERNRMARDIHDTLAQGFTGVIVQLEAVEEAISHGLAPKATEFLNRASALARESLQEARRSVQALRPRTLEENDLCEALQSLTRKMTFGTSVQAKFDVRGQQPELPQEWEENLLRIGQEVITNVLRHAHAAHFHARLGFEDGKIRLVLADDGNGFDPAGRHDGFGLRGIRERVAAMGGQLSIESTKGKGTTISIVLPNPNLPKAAPS